MVAVPQSVVEQVYQYVVELHRKGNLSLALRLGRQVVNKLLGSDLDPWRQQGREHPSVRQLAAMISKAQETSISSARYVHVYEMDTRLQLQKIPCVTLSHAVEALAAPAADQRGWLEKVAPHTWSSRELGAPIGK